MSWQNNAGDGMSIEAWTGDAKCKGGEEEVDCLEERRALWDEVQASGGLWLRREGGESGCQTLNNDPVQSAPAQWRANHVQYLRIGELSHPSASHAK